MTLRTREWRNCIRPGCLRQRLDGWPLCFEDWDQLPAGTREAWQASAALSGKERHQARVRWQVTFQERYARRIPLMSISIPAWTPAPPAKRRKGAA